MDTSLAVQSLIVLAAQNHWHVDVMGKFGMPPCVVFKNRWRYEPMPYCTLPPVAVKRAQAVINSGVPVQGFVIGHQEPLKVDKRVIYGVVGVVAVVALWNVIMSLLPALMVMTVITLMIVADPVLIVVTEEGEWISIASWYD